jgi:pimeloyl-ACP methyl ester carboxylesterase
MSIKIILLILTTVYQAIANLREAQKKPPGKLIDVGGYRLHYYVLGESLPPNPTIILDHSLGGIEGYLLIKELSKLARVFIYDRAGYGWSDHSPYPRTSQQIVKELELLLTQTGMEPPYILIGNSFGSYNVRLYAYSFPQKVDGIIFTDGLHERGMLKMPLSIKILKLFFISGFFMSVFGSFLGIIRLLRLSQAFELLKPELRHFSPKELNYVKRSFCRVKHWITMIREMVNLDLSSHQVSIANNLGMIPVVSIQANSFFTPKLWTMFIPLKKINNLRAKMHLELSNLSKDCLQINAAKSGHFVWIDQPDVIVDAVKKVLKKINYYE